MSFLKFDSEYRDNILEFIAGLTSGTAGVSVGHPFDTIKVRQQSDFAFAGQKNPNALRCFIQTIFKEGPLALFQGMTAPIVMASSINAVIFSSYGQTLRLLGVASDFERQPAFRESFIAGLAAGFVQSFLACPTELLKCRLQLQHHSTDTVSLQPKYRGNVDCISQILKSQGPRGLYQGLFCTMYRDVPSYGLYFALYESLRPRLAAKSVGLSDFQASAIGGAVAGSIAWAVIYPIDTVKTKIQGAPLAKGNAQRTMFFQVFRSLYCEGGLQRLFRGLGATILRALPVNAVVFPVYETVLKELKRL